MIIVINEKPQHLNICRKVEVERRLQSIICNLVHLKKNKSASKNITPQRKIKKVC